MDSQYSRVGRKIVLYHGTTARNARSILDEGLRPSVKDADIQRNENVTDSPSVAKEFGGSSLLKIEIPESEKDEYLISYVSPEKQREMKALGFDTRYALRKTVPSRYITPE
ncbi:MAG: hypothetical protein KGN01_08115 [Patescibacteria group bacterium]|nr:hypothetical protein [Patescibacteria group bacterium]